MGILKARDGSKLCVREIAHIGMRQRSAWRHALCRQACHSVAKPEYSRPSSIQSDHSLRRDRCCDVDLVDCVPVSPRGLVLRQLAWHSHHVDGAPGATPAEDMWMCVCHHGRHVCTELSSRAGPALRFTDQFASKLVSNGSRFIRPTRVHVSAQSSCPASTNDGIDFCSQYMLMPARRGVCRPARCNSCIRKLVHS
jgi:hypothetical protein